MTRAELAAQLAAWRRCTRASATPGPWRAESHPHRGSVHDHGEKIAETWCGTHEGHGGTNAAFIAAARDAVPVLIGALRNAWAARDEAQAQLAVAQQVCDAAVEAEREACAAVADERARCCGTCAVAMTKAE